MQVIGVTGTRKLTALEIEQVKYELWELDRNGTHWHIGDADEVDKTARNWVTGEQTHYNTEGMQKWQLAARSTKLVKALAASGGTLHAWANKLAPVGLMLEMCKRVGNLGDCGSGGRAGGKSRIALAG